MPHGGNQRRAQHVNHPTCRWVRARKEHYLFTCVFALHLCEEYTKRYAREHACEKRIRHLTQSIPAPEPCELNAARVARSGLPKGIEWFPLAMPEECFVRDNTGELNAVESYKKYYTYKSKHMVMKWNKGKYKRRIQKVHK